MENIMELIEIINNSEQSAESKVKLLKLHRYQLLDEMHKKQQLLDQIDYLIIQLKENKKL